MKKSNFMLFIALSILAIYVLACATAPPVKKAELKDTVDVQIGEKAAPIQLKKVIVKLPRRAKIGLVLVGGLCVPRRDLIWRGGKVALSTDEFTEVFREELEKANYQVVGDPNALFDDPSAWKAELLVGGLITKIEANICYPMSGFGNWTDAKGEAYVKVEWQIYARLDRRVVYTTTTEGSISISEPVAGGDTDLLLDAFASATHNLLADREFHDLVVKSKPTSPKPTFADLAIKKTTVFKSPINLHINDVRVGVATVFAGERHGSGFFISSDGFLLTNAHVVGGAKFVKVKIATGRELLGEVIRTDRRRDVALIKVEETNMVPIPIRMTEASVGDEVYCLGSPLDEKYSTTMSRGIVSGYRIEDEMKFLQSDVNILSGSSGGPLVDCNGNVIGVAVSGWTISGAPSGINFFIPIKEAIERLNIKLEFQ